jgi:hypothetical protein
MKINAQRISSCLLLVFFTALLHIPAQAQKGRPAAALPGSSSLKEVMWEPTNIGARDLFFGPGRRDGQPDLSRVTFIKEEKGGHNKKYRIKDADGNVWVAKLGREARPETAAVRLLWALGYKTEINYLVPSITIPGKGTFRNVRVEARPANIEREGEWKWRSNPFLGTRELQGLKIMMVLMTNWDVLDLQNKILQTNGERHYIVSDLGATFGKLGNNNLPVIYRLGRKTGSPKHFSRTQLVRRVKGNIVELSYKGKNRGIFKDITVGDARWLADLLLQLRDDQIRDAFRAASYSPAEIDTYLRTIRSKIAELDRAGRGSSLAADHQ